MKNKKEIYYDKINDGFIYINFKDERVYQMQCIYHPTQDNWYIYGSKNQDNNGDLISVNIKTINGSEFKYLLILIDRELTLQRFFEILLESGYRNYCKCYLHYIRYSIIPIELQDSYSNNDVHKKTISIYEYL